jgi:hypothetical protein
VLLVQREKKLVERELMHLPMVVGAVEIEMMHLGNMLVV